jgi:fructose-1,6-bisphosphatase/inositol monophosphatase family enzyme
LEGIMTSADESATTPAGIPAPAAVASRAELLRETSIHHGSFEAVAPPHDWWDWYAAYMLAREAGSTSADAAAAANRYMAEVKHVVVSSA